MPRKTKEEVLKYYKTETGINKLEIIKIGLESGSIKNFQQVFAIIAKTNVQSLLGVEFYAFDKKIEDPGRFSFNEAEILADFFKVKYEVVERFIRTNQLEMRKKGKRK